MPGSPPTLRDMVQDALDRGQTLEQLESKAVDPQTHKRTSKSFFSRIKRDEVDRVPTDYHLRGIAAALGAPYEAVRRAAIAQWLPGGDDSDGELREQVQHLSELTAKLLDKVGEGDSE